jgi:hypothetical protein
MSTSSGGRQPDHEPLRQLSAEVVTDEHCTSLQRHGQCTRITPVKYSSRSFLVCWEGLILMEECDVLLGVQVARGE